MAILHSESTMNIHKSQIWTNLGNLYSHLGRLSEAMDAWNRALEYTPDFGMAIGNMGQCVYKYGGYLHDEKLRSLFLHTSYKMLRKAIVSKTLQENAKIEYCKMIAAIESTNKPDILNKEIVFDEILEKENYIHKEYRRWCILNKLVLNEANDLVISDAVAYDILEFPAIHIEGKKYSQNKSDFYFSMYNEIKQQYVSARYFVYKGTIRDFTHFSDKNNLLAMKTDYSNYSYNLELIKVGFKQCYSILDKIAYFLREYLDLNIKCDRVSFLNIWRIDGKVRDVFINDNNHFLKALYWLSKDINPKNPINEVLNPDIENINNLRNFMEHKSLNIVDYCDQIFITKDNLTLTISRNDLETKCTQLLSLVRSAIIYLFLGVHLNERQKSKGDGIYGSIYYGILDDEYKI